MNANKEKRTPSIDCCKFDEACRLVSAGKLHMRGFSRQQIAEILHISQKAVGVYLKTLGAS